MKYVNINPRTTAALLIEVTPAGSPGKVNIDLTNAGRETLTLAESVDLLRTALALVELRARTAEGGDEELRLQPGAELPGM